MGRGGCSEALARRRLVDETGTGAGVFSEALGEAVENAAPGPFILKYFHAFSWKLLTKSNFYAIL